MEIATGFAPKACTRPGTMRPARRIPTGEVAAFRPIISVLVPQDSIVRESNGKASPSEMVKTQTAAHAAMTLRRLTSGDVVDTRSSQCNHTHWGGGRCTVPHAGYLRYNDNCLPVGLDELEPGMTIWTSAEWPPVGFVAPISTSRWLFWPSGIYVRWAQFKHLWRAYCAWDKAERKKREDWDSDMHSWG
jgi:hypothetical protein